MCLLTELNATAQHPDDVTSVPAAVNIPFFFFFFFKKKKTLRRMWEPLQFSFMTNT